MSSTIQVRMNPKLKKEVQKILDAIGLDLSGAIKMYFQQITIRQGIPFLLLTRNGMTPAEERELLKDIAWAKKHGKRYGSAKELHEAIMKE